MLLDAIPDIVGGGPGLLQHLRRLDDRVGGDAALSFDLLRPVSPAQRRHELEDRAAGNRSPRGCNAKGAEQGGIAADGAPRRIVGHGPGRGLIPVQIVW